MNDLINGLFESIGSIAIWLNVIRLYQDKKIAGINISTTVFFTSWGLWNMYYYPSLGQWLSFWGGLSMCVANSIWIAMSLYYVYFYTARK